jgi:hypothetical protein
MKALERLEEGRARLARVLKTLLSKNALSHAALKTFHDWAEPDQRTWISPSQMSGLRTSRLKAPGPRAFDSLGQINLRLAQIAGVDCPDVRRLSDLPPVLPPEVKRLRESAWCARRPDNGLPMNAGDLFLVWLGRLDPELDEVGYSDREARAVCERLALVAQAWLHDQDLLPSQGRREIEERCPPNSQARRDRLWNALMGGSALTGVELAEEEEAVRALVGRLSPKSEPLTSNEFERWIAGGALFSGTESRS